MLHVVMRPIPGPEGDIPSGTLVEPKDWRNLKPLVEARFLRPVTPDDVEGLETIEVDKHGISDTNILGSSEQEPEPKNGKSKAKSKPPMRIGKKR